MKYKKIELEDKEIEKAINKELEKTEATRS